MSQLSSGRLSIRVCAANPWEFAPRLLFLVLVLCIPAVLWAQERRLVLSANVTAPYTTPDRRGFLDQLVAAIFLDLNHQAEIVVDTAPSGHSLMLASQGADDGLAMRVEGLEDTYPNLIRVPESVAHSDFVAMSRRHVFSPVGWSSLAPFKVSFLSGWAIFENRVPAEVSARPVDRVEHMLQLLHQGRVDVLLYERWQGLVMARRAGVELRTMEPALATEPMYMYLHVRHADLVPQVTMALRRIKRNGTYQRIYDDTLRPLLRAGVD